MNFGEYSNSLSTSKCVNDSVARVKYLHSPTFRRVGKIEEKSLAYTLAICVLKIIISVGICDY